MNPLIIRAELVNPPSFDLSLWTVTMHVSENLQTPVVIEADYDATDIYFRYMKERGLLDYVEQFVLPMEVEGAALDLMIRRPSTIFVDRVAPENLHMILREIEQCLSWHYVRDVQPHSASKRKSRPAA